MKIAAGVDRVVRFFQRTAFLFLVAQVSLAQATGNASSIEWTPNGDSGQAMRPAPELSRPVYSDFPRYPELEPAVQFWVRVFGVYSENQSLIHSSVYPQKILTVLDFSSAAKRMDKRALARHRSKSERAAREKYNELFRRLHLNRNKPESLSGEELRIYKLFADIPDPRRFSKAQGTVRSQRGLHERTRKALEVSGKYLPEMTRTFASHGLPTLLTRLPLVESSFNVEAYSKAGAAGLWQFIPSSARSYMRLNEIVDDRRDPWTSTDAAARHLKDDYALLQDWPLAITAYNHGRAGVARGLRKVNGKTLPDLVARYKSRRFGFASRNFYAEFLAALEVERNREVYFGPIKERDPLQYEIVRTKDYLKFSTLRMLAGAPDPLFRKLNPAYSREVVLGKLYVPPGHVIRVPKGDAARFQANYAKLDAKEKHSSQRHYYVRHRVRHGETVSRIARRYGVSARSITSANQLRSAHRIRVGQTLKIPPRGRPGRHVTQVAKAPQKDGYHIHRVRRGQNLWTIARLYGASLQEVLKANGLRKSSVIHPGMRIRVPST